MMSMKEKLEVFHIEKPQAMGLQLYYKSRDLSLLILLPEDIDGLDQVQSVCREGVSGIYPSGEKQDMVSLFVSLIPVEEDNQHTLSLQDFTFTVSFKFYKIL